MVRTAYEVSLWVDGKRIISYTPARRQQFAVAGYDEASREVIVKVVNPEGAPWRAAIRLDNAGAVAPEGRVISLSARSLEDENSFEEPLKISPETGTASGLSRAFEYEFKPFSYTVLRIAAGR